MPVLLDLFCGAGGASMGYRWAGFTVVGVDCRPQPRYPFEFIQADALEFMATADLSRFDAFAASPPCQGFSVSKSFNTWRKHDNYIEPVREFFRETKKPYAIENVENAPLIHPVILCGLNFGLQVKRHRAFETTVRVPRQWCPYNHPGDWYTIYGGSVATRRKPVSVSEGERTVYRSEYVKLDVGRKAMGIYWPMNRYELSQAIPPAYTKHIGKYLLTQLRVGSR